MSDRNITLRGALIEGTNQRAFIDSGRAGDTGPVTVHNVGPDVLERSAKVDGSTPTTIALPAAGNLTGRRYLRSRGVSNVHVITPAGAIEGVVIGWPRSRSRGPVGRSAAPRCVRSPTRSSRHP